MTRLPLPTVSTAAFGTVEGLQPMGIFENCLSTGLAMPCASEGTCPALFQVELSTTAKGVRNGKW